MYSLSLSAIAAVCHGSSSSSSSSSDSVNAHRNIRLCSNIYCHGTKPIVLFSVLLHPHDIHSTAKSHVCNDCHWCYDHSMSLFGAAVTSHNEDYLATYLACRSADAGQQRLCNSPHTYCPHTSSKLPPAANTTT